MILGGVALLAWSVTGLLTSYNSRVQQLRVWDTRASATAFHGGPAAAFVHPALAAGQQVAKMEVPRLGYRAVVLEGTDTEVIDNGPGHLIGSAFPGDPATLVVAEHNTYWLGFPDLRAGDRVTFTDDDGTFTYLIDSQKVVENSQWTVPGGTMPRLMLSTCWPIWAGAFANQKLVIYGHLA